MSVVTVLFTYKYNQLFLIMLCLVSTEQVGGSRAIRKKDDGQGCVVNKSIRHLGIDVDIFPCIGNILPYLYD